MSIYCNSDFTHNFKIRGKQNVAIPLPPGAEIEIVMVHVNSKERFVCNTTNGLVVIGDSADGRFSLELPASFTRDLPVGEYNLDGHRTDDQRTLLFRAVTKVEAQI